MHNLTTPVVVILALIVLFFILREVLTWYWKFSRMVELLEKIEQNTRNLGNKVDVAANVQPVIPREDPPAASNIVTRSFLPGENDGR